MEDLRKKHKAVLEELKIEINLAKESHQVVVAKNEAWKITPEKKEVTYDELAVELCKVKSATEMATATAAQAPASGGTATAGRELVVAGKDESVKRRGNVLVVTRDITIMGGDPCILMRVTPNRPPQPTFFKIILPFWALPITGRVILSCEIDIEDEVEDEEEEEASGTSNKSGSGTDASDEDSDAVVAGPRRHVYVIGNGSDSSAK